MLTTSERSGFGYDVEIYDDVDGRLKRMFRFAPLVAARLTPHVSEPTEGVSRYEDVPFHIEEITPIDGAGPDSVIFGALNVEVKGATRRVPVTISWSIARRRYLLGALLVKSTTFQPYQDTDPQYQVVRELALNTPRLLFSIHDRYTKIDLQAFAVTSYALVQAPGDTSQYLVGAVVMDQTQVPVGDILEINLWQLEAEEDEIVAGPCTARQLPAFYKTPIPAEEDHRMELEDIWQKYRLGQSEGLTCIDLPPELREEQEEAARHGD